MEIFLEPELATRKNKILAPLIKRYRYKVAIAKIPNPLRTVLQVTLQSDDGKLVFVKNSKAGCTTVANAIYRYSKGVDFDGNIHQKRDNFRQGIQHALENKLAYEHDNNFKFTFVRNPETRAISAFRDFFVEQRNPAKKLHLGPMRNIGFSEKNSVTRNLDIYLSYIEACMDQDIIRTDRHFRPQVFNVGYGTISYDYIGRVENLDGDLRTAFEMAGIKNFLTSKKFTKHNSSLSTQIEISIEQRHKIEKLYAKDYDAFEYS